MLKTKIMVMAVVVAGAVASFSIQHRADAQFLQRERLLGQQKEELAALTDEQQRISNALVHATTARTEDHAPELAKLRTEVESLCKQTNELARLSQQRCKTSKPQSPNGFVQHPQEYWDQLRAAAGAKSIDARNLSLVIWEYATEHNKQKQFPTSLDQVAPFLNKDPNSTLSGTNQFDLVFQGSIDDLDGIPNTEIAVVRDRETWTMPDGKTYRAYGMMGGMGQIVGSDDNFQSWEAEHVIGTLKK
jgi:hypothetical protein